MWHFHLLQALQPLLELPQVQYWEQRQLGKDDRHVKVDRYANIEAQSVVSCWVEFRYFMDRKDACHELSPSGVLPWRCCPYPK